MKKVLLLLDCDSCRCLYNFTRFASEDTTAWDFHGGAIAKMALRDGWARTEDDNYHYCPDCVEQLEEEFQLYLLFD
ncbi:MAG: hypothetical protein MN733_17775 [Nitrososphaera sp.]|nr:hypothetical protein [Nitrososphaera sp.]